MCRQVRGAGGQPFDFDLLGFSRQRFPIPFPLASSLFSLLLLMGAGAFAARIDPEPVGCSPPTYIEVRSPVASDGLWIQEFELVWPSDREPVWLCMDGSGHVVEARWRSHWISRRFPRDELEIATDPYGEEVVRVFVMGSWHTPSARGGLAGAFEAWWPVAVVGVAGVVVGTLLAARLGQARRRGRRARR